MIGQLTSLQSLNLDHNQITTLTPVIGQLTALQRLGLDDNHLTTLPPEIGQLTALQRLDLTHNQLTTLPPALGRLLPGSIAEVKERQFRIGHEIERLEGLVSAYRSGGKIFRR